MKNFVSRLFLLLPLLGVPVVSAGQERPAESGRPGDARPVHQHSGVGMLLRHRAALGLTDAQIGRLHAIAEELEEKNRLLLRQLKEAGIPVHGSGQLKDHKLTAAQEEELRKKLEAHKPVLHQLQKNTRAAMSEAYGVLTLQQRDRLRAIMDAQPRSHNTWEAEEGGLEPKKAPFYGD